MAQAARPSPPNPSAASSWLALALPARRPDAPPPPRAARVKDTACPTSSCDRGDSGQGKKAPEHTAHRSSGGTYSKPDARVKLIPVEDITYVRHGKPFGRTVGSVGLQKKNCRRSLTPPPSSRKVSLVRSTPITQKPTTPAPPVASKKHCRRSLAPTPSSRKVSLGRPTPLTQKPTTPAPPVASCLSPKRFEIAENRQIVSLNRPSPIRKAVQRGATLPAAHSSKAPLGTEAEPSSKSVSPPDNRRLCSTRNWATVKCQRTRSNVDPIVQKEPTVEPSLLGPTSVLSIRSTEDTRSRPSVQRELIIPLTESPQSTTPAQSVELPNDFEAVHTTKSHISNERQTNQEESIDDNVSSGAPVILHTELHKKHYPSKACWKGKFEVIGEQTHTCDGLEAHFPLEIFIKVYEASKQMPEILKLEALPLLRLWPKIFKMEPPDGQDIGLCFISSLQRANRNFDHLLENISSHIGLRTDIGSMELLIFSSKLLTKDYQTKDGKFYFWGVFRKHLRKKQHQYNNHTNNVEISNACVSNGYSRERSEDIGMNLGLTEGIEIKSDECEISMKLDATVRKEMDSDKPKEIGKIFDQTGDKRTDRDESGKSSIKLDLTGIKETNQTDNCLVMLKTPDSNAAVNNAAPAVSFVTRSCSPDSADSACKSSKRAPACQELVLDSPPRFSLDVPPGFTKAHCWLRTGATAESYIDSSSSLVLDTLPGFPLDVPPGFTDAHRGLHTITCPGSETGASTLVSEKKPPIKFSLNIIRPVQTDIPPGFAKLLEVKKEPGLHAVYKATEKTTPIGKVDEVKIKHDKVNVEVEESSEEREFPKTKRLSDLLGLSSSNNNTSTLSTPRNCAAVCRSVPVPLVDKFQETQAPEKQKHCRKRGQQESSEPSAADTTKRLKVNGLMALNKRLKVNGLMALNRCLNHRALNSNQAQGNSGES